MKTQFHHHTPPLLVSNSMKSQSAQNNENTDAFSMALNESIQQSKTNLTISKHASMRLNQRNIDIDSNTWAKIEEKVKQAKTMGVQDALVLVNNAALIVSAKNNVVVTAMAKEEANKQIFTNINGTILIG